MSKKAVVKKQTTELDRPSYMKGASRGSEEVKIENLAIPRLSIIQALSPQRKKNDPNYIDGAEEGMIFNTVTCQLYEDGVTVVPCYFRPEWVLWKSMDSGGGFVGAFSSPEEAQRALEHHDDARDLEIVDTSNQFCLLINDSGRIDEVVISMSASQQKISRQWNSMIRVAGGDRFERMYKLEAVGVQNSRGQDYFNWKVTQLGYVSEEVYNRAEGLYAAIASGKRDINREVVEVDEE